VLLRSTSDSSHGFAAKVADFGLARDFSIISRLETRTYGTMTHMAPEVLASDTLSKASDVYSFGVILWEMYTGQRAWASLNFAQVGPVVRRRMRFLLGLPTYRRKRVLACLVHDRLVCHLLQVIHVVAIENKTLQPPADTPPQLARLMRLCMARDAAKRPTFEALTAELGHLPAELTGTANGWGQC
jgi:serine/threonine protein kinase